MARTPDKPALSLVDPAATGIEPPRSLGKHGRALWDSVQREYGITDRGGIELLCLACQALDGAEALTAAIARDGETYIHRGVPKAHPALRDELARRAFVSKTLERLGLNVEAVKSRGRPGKPQGIGWDQL